MKVFTLTLVTVLLCGATGAVKLRRAEKRSSLEDETKPSESDSKTDIIEANADKKEKEVHKRGILHYGNGFAAAAHGGSFWPKTYASHYGYNLHLPAANAYSTASFSGAHVHAPTALRYNTGFHYKTLAAPAVYSGVSSLSGALPTYASVGPTVSYGHQAAVATAQPFIIRPGGAVVQSYSVNYPHHKPAVAVKPVHTFASVAPVQHLHPVQAVQSVQPIQPIHTFQHVPAVQAIQPVQPLQHLQPVQPIHTFQTVQHVQPVQPVQAVQSIQPVHHYHPVQPVHSVAQVQHFKPPVHYDVTQQFPSYFQTTFAQQPVPVPAIPQVPDVTFTPAQPAFPAIPQFPNPPAFPSIPSVPAVPAVPAFPNIPTIPSIPNFPQPQVPTNGFFPVSVQPPLPQQPPSFVSFNPAAQFPGFGPVAGTPNHNNPDFGSAEAAPQIPAQPEPSPEPELPAPQPQPTQQPWKPVFYQPPTAESPLDRPSHTLLPPYGSSPAEGYLPPAASSNNHKGQQEYTIDSHLFDNLSDADIQNIFSQANLAAQQDQHHHHTVHNYHSSHY